jgi:hypothetical protein
MSNSICLTLVLIFAVVLFLLDRRIARLEQHVTLLTGGDRQQPKATGGQQIDSAA